MIEGKELEWVEEMVYSGQIILSFRNGRLKEKSRRIKKKKKKLKISRRIF